MATSLSPFEQDLSCPVCFEIFNDPVILSCSHSFCRTCLQRSWEEKMERECPVCRRRSSDNYLSSNLALRNTCESYLQQKRVQDSDPQRCSRHFEKLSLFCEKDEKLVCTQCVSEDHKNHSFCSISKAASPRKEKLKTHLTNMEAKLNIFKKFKDISDQTAGHIKCQAQNTERGIKEEFEKLHQFLRDEEEATVAALKEEEEEKSQRVKKKIEQLDKQIMEISSRVTELNSILKNDALIVQDFRRASERAQYIVADPELESGALMDVAKHLGNLSYRVWKKMKNLCPYFPVILDPNIANSSLSLSADLSSISHSAENPQLPDNPERMSGYNGVLGSEGFSSGTHSWEVEVGNSEDWIVGVAEETVSRKKGFLALPENGFCCIWRYADEISAGISKDTSETLMTKPTIRRIRVTLKWEKGLVTFSNTDYNTDLYTFAHTFTKKMYPYFYNESVRSLKVLPKDKFSFFSNFSSGYIR
ncbi:nuclear factor 7, brain-like [Pygocentrus nattereri]|uniref:nuclear factor 7, brain-like n=1 Tax=Pygocentrus nattereri TaxID=42514 RepID=UPI001890E214|nr:nuclear factor 7, brain-like [Pygocentrus nattereri]